MSPQEMVSITEEDLSNAKLSIVDGEVKGFHLAVDVVATSMSEDEDRERFVMGVDWARPASEPLTRESVEMVDNDLSMSEATTMDRLDLIDEVIPTSMLQLISKPEVDDKPIAFMGVDLGDPDGDHAAIMKIDKGALVEIVHLLPDTPLEWPEERQIPVDIALPPIATNSAVKRQASRFVDLAADMIKSRARSPRPRPSFSMPPKETKVPVNGPAQLTTRCYTWAGGCDGTFKKPIDSKEKLCPSCRSK